MAKLYVLVKKTSTDVMNVNAIYVSHLTRANVNHSAQTKEKLFLMTLMTLAVLVAHVFVQLIQRVEVILAVSFTCYSANKTVISMESQ